MRQEGELKDMGRSCPPVNGGQPGLYDRRKSMTADMIIKNAKIFTSDKDNPWATALAVKDGKFIYVGDETGLSDVEGEVIDLNGKFIMPGIIDSHVHITTGVGFEYVDYGEEIACSGKKEALDLMEKYIRNHPGLERYRFMLERASLNGEDFVKEELDAICRLLPRFGDYPVVLDLSVIDDTDYYNGLLFRGFADGVARPVLSGGRYDHLLHRMGRSGSAVGFAVYLSELESLLWEDEETAATVLEYGPKDDPAAVAAAAKAAAERGGVQVRFRSEREAE